MVKQENIGRATRLRSGQAQVPPNKLTNNRVGPRSVVGILRAGEKTNFKSSAGIQGFFAALAERGRGGESGGGFDLKNRRPFACGASEQGREGRKPKTFWLSACANGAGSAFLLKLFENHPPDGPAPGRVDLRVRFESSLQKRTSVWSFGESLAPSLQWTSSCPSSETPREG